MKGVRQFSRLTPNQEGKLGSKLQQPSSKFGSSTTESDISHQGNRCSWLQWFYDLSISHKQLVGLLLSQVISILGLVGIGAYLIISGGRSQLQSQAKSELAVSQLSYNLKLDQMGFGFRGQSDNAAIIAASQAYAAGKPLEPVLSKQIQQILSNEITTRNIEYATLVGTDLRIIANANQDRTGEKFNPKNLVREVLTTHQQLKTSEIVSWAELAKESPPLPSDFHGQDALIRYTVTPVIYSPTQEVLAILVSGDIVNGKPKIVQQTLDTLNGGWSAVYLRPSSGEFALATAVQSTDNHQLGKLEESSPTKYLFNVPLPDLSLLKATIAANGQPVIRRITIEGQNYTAAAKTLSNFAGEPVAVLVRGTPEIGLNQLLKNKLQLQLVVSFLALAANGALVMLLGQTITKPLKQLKQKAQEFSASNLQVRAEVWARDEIGQLAHTFNHMAQRIVCAMEQLENSIQEQSSLNIQLQHLSQLQQEKNQQLQTTLYQLQQAQSQLVQQEKMASLGQLLAGVAHEINNPVSFIYGNINPATEYAEELLQLIELYQHHYPQPVTEIAQQLELAELDFIATDFPKLLSSMEEGAKRICSLVQSLKNFSHNNQEEGKLVDIHQHIDSTLLILQHRLKAKSRRCEIQLLKEYGELPLVYCYPGLLSQVFMNLLCNAIDALENGQYEESLINVTMGESRFKNSQLTTTNSPMLGISTQVIDDRFPKVAIRIVDNGSGIPLSIQERIFDPFFTTKPVGKGTGLGLAISYRIVVEQHQGRLHCKSTPGKGTEFVVELPLVL
ncbi:MAG: HAMP domain-containing protein [Symploca sp. SIO3E6]|nr:HAMP domain-containing protein [Caldora sp. SIO3E6]